MTIIDPQIVLNTAGSHFEILPEGAPPVAFDHSTDEQPALIVDTYVPPSKTVALNPANAEPIAYQKLYLQTDQEVDWLGNPEWEVRDSAAKLLNEKIPQLKEEDRLKLVLKAAEFLGASKWGIRESAFKALEQIIPHLKIQDRLDPTLMLETFLEDSDWKIQELALKALANIIPYLKAEHQLDQVLKIEEYLSHFKWPIREPAVVIFADMIPHLGEMDRLKLVLKVEERLKDPDWDIRALALETLEKIIPHLKEDHRLDRTLEIEKYLGDLVGYVCGEAMHALKKIIPHLKEGDRLGRALAIEKCAGDSDTFVRRYAEELLRTTIPYLSKADLLVLALQVKKRLWAYEWHLRRAPFETLTKIIPDLNEKDLLSLAFKEAEELKDSDEDIRHYALETLIKIIPFLKAVDLPLVLSPLWERNLLESIEFRDGGNGVSRWTKLIEGVLKDDFPPSPIITDVSQMASAFFSEDFFKNSISYGRSTVKTMEDGTLLVFKALKEGQSLNDLMRELAWAHQSKELGLRSTVVTPWGIVKKEKNQGICFKAPANYYQYLTDQNVSDVDFKTGLFNAIHDVFLLAKKGLYHMVPIRLFHNAEPGSQYRSSGDRGRYTWMPDLVFGYTSRPGMGRLDNWNGALEYGNYGLSGLRDLEEVATLDEVMNHGEKWAPELRNLKDKPKAKALYDMAILGNHLLAGVLYLGDRLRKEAQKADEHLFWKDEEKLKPYATLLHEMFSVAHAIKNNISEDRAQEIMKDKADWLKMARQMAFFMTKAYVPFVKPGANAQDFPQEIYGTETKVIITREPYRDHSFNAEGNGWVGPSGQVDQLSLGPVNGQFPIREFEKAAFATFVPWHLNNNDSRDEVNTQQLSSTPDLEFNVLTDDANSIFATADELLAVGDEILETNPASDDIIRSGLMGDQMTDFNFPGSVLSTTTPFAGVRAFVQ